jgi:hypothetical protein
MSACLTEEDMETIHCIKCNTDLPRDQFWKSCIYKTFAYCISCLRKERGSKLRTSLEPLIGQVFGRLTVIGDGGLLYVNRRGRKGRRAWEVQCECGNIVIRRAEAVKTQKYNSNGCDQGCAARKEGTAFRGLYATYKANAIKRGYEWGLTEEQFKELTSGPCYYTGRLPSSICRSKAGEVYIYNGVDRLDNTKGYVIGNVVACSGDVNIAKNTLSEDEFYSLVKDVYHHKIQGPTTLQMVG